MKDTRKCREDCTTARPTAPCSCNCGGACHAMGACNPESHRFDKYGMLRRPTAGPFATSTK